MRSNSATIAAIIVACVVQVACKQEPPDEGAGAPADGSVTTAEVQPSASPPPHITPPVAETGTGTTPQPPEPPAEPPPEPPRCLPEAKGPFWIVEGMAVTATVSCSTGLVEPTLAYDLSPLPEGATFDPKTGALSWTPALDQAGVYTFTLTETSTGETGKLKVGVADAFDADGNEGVDPSTYTEEFGLPVMHLSFEGKLTSWEKRPAKVVYRGHTYDILAKYRGATSLDFPKRSFTLEFPDTDEFDDPSVGMGNRDKLALVTTFNDNSYLRVPLAFEVWKRMDPGNIPVKTFPVVVFVNGKYFGLYTAVDHIDSDLMKRQGLPKDGDLFKAWHQDANFKLFTEDGQEKWWLAQGYEKKEGFPEHGQSGAYKNIEDLTGFIATSSDADFKDDFATWMTPRDYENWWIFITLTLATDSGGKNAYHYRAPDGSPFRYIPWDLDASFGQDWDTRRTSAHWRYDFQNKNKLFERMLNEPTIAGPMRARYKQLFDGPLKKSEVLAAFDALHDKVHDVALRDEVRWGNDYRWFTRWSDRTDFRTYEDEAAYVRKWIDDRWESLKNDGVP